MANVHDLARVAEAVGKRVLEREQESWRAEPVDDNEHIPRLRRIIQAVTDAAQELEIPSRDAEALQTRLERYAQDQYMQTWMSDLYEDEDPEQVRAEGLRVFRHVWEGGRR